MKENAWKPDFLHHTENPHTLIQDFMKTSLKLPPDTIHHITCHRNLDLTNHPDLLHQSGSTKSSKPAKGKEYKFSREINTTNFSTQGQLYCDLQNHFILFCKLLHHIFHRQTILT